MRSSFKVFFCLYLLLSAPLNAAGAEGLSARRLFEILPGSIFENTEARLDEAEKRALLEEGISRSWQISDETPDAIVFSSYALPRRTVVVRVFRHAGAKDCIAAIGTQGDSICTVELWKVDASGRITPFDTPVEPSIGEFFSSRRRPPLDQQNSVLICLGKDGLLAKPVFWNENGFSVPRIDREISYKWNGAYFEREVRNIQSSPKYSKKTTRK